MKEQLAESRKISHNICVHTGRKARRVCLSFRSHDVCCQLGTTGRWFAVAASANVNHCYSVGLATGVMGSRLLLGMHWPRDLVVATLISWALVAVATAALPTNLWAINTTCGRKSRNSATRTRKLMLVDFPNLALKSSTMRVDAISQMVRKWYFKGLLW